VAAADEEVEVGSPGIRPFWAGTISFGLVSIPVALFSATRARSTVGLRMLGEDGTPLERRYVCSTEETPLDWDDIVRGYEVKKGKFVVVTDDELEAIEPKKSRDIDLRLFVDQDEIDPKYFERGYFLTPTGGSTKAYRLLATVMEKNGRAGIATFVMRTKQYVIAILAENGILRAETLRFADEVRSPDDVGLPEPQKTKPAAVTKFTKAITTRSKKVDFREFLDDYNERLEKLARSKQKKKEDVIRVDEPENAGDSEGAEVIDLLQVLQRSLNSGGAAARRPAKKAGPSKKRASKKK
jgi:DNA end-binding protein Ku